MKGLLTLAILIIAASLFATQDNHEYNVQLRDRTQLRGTYLAVNEGNMLYRTERFPLVLIPLSSIRSLYKGRQDVTTLLMTNQLPAIVSLTDSIETSALNMPVQDPDMATAVMLGEIRSSIRTASVPVWIMAVLSVITTIIVLK